MFGRLRAPHLARGLRAARARRRGVSRCPRSGWLRRVSRLRERRGTPVAVGVSVLPGGHAVRRGRLAFAAAVLIGGCATGRQLVSPRTEYRLYRRAALAPTVEERLGAANRYLHAAPNGVYAAELRSWFAPAESTYVKRAHDELPLLLA